MKDNQIGVRWLSGISVGLLLFVTGCSTQGGSERLKEDSGVFDVMTYNIRNGQAKDGVNDWTHRKGMVVDVIDEYQGDVVGLQEAFDFQADFIAKSLPQYGMYYVCRKDGVKEGESCAILYKRGRFELVDSGTFWFSDTPGEPSTHWGNWNLRICSWVRLVNKSDGQGLYVYNLHLDHQSQNSREKSAQLLAKQISQRKTKDPFIVMGDFNMTIDNPGMKYLLKDGVETPYRPLISAWVSTHPQGEDLKTGHGFKGGTEGKAIDHILIDAKAVVLKANIDQRQIDGKYPSDHYPVTATVKLY
ncbi:MAG: endonuclease/exonuclease/phosphatase family protein [Phycisphaerae bacterium]|nr:endonuclease/exonuclease/phosphatase family protein [Phycisphaerae bacterium]